MNRVNKLFSVYLLTVLTVSGFACSIARGGAVAASYHFPDASDRKDSHSGGRGTGDRPFNQLRTREYSHPDLVSWKTPSSLDERPDDKGGGGRSNGGTRVK